MCVCSTSVCIEGVCSATGGPFPFVCEIEVGLSTNNSISHVNYYCRNDLLATCSMHPLITESESDTSKSF